jgi:hypothetical protein
VGALGLHVVTIEEGGDGPGHDLTDDISALGYSNVRPGGDERCTFTYHRPWASSVPEINKGNLVRVLDGIDVLWQGRIEEQDRGGDDDEQIAVTAYGLGARLKDNQLRIIYVDTDLSHWEGMSVQERLNLIDTTGPSDASTAPDDTTGEPALETAQVGAWTAASRAFIEGWYNAGDGLLIDSLYFAWKKGSTVNAADANWLWQVDLSTDDVVSSTDTSGDLRSTGPGTGTVTATGDDKQFARVLFRYAAVTAGQDNIRYPIFWTCLAVYGDHTLTPQGEEGDATTPRGFLSSDMIADAAGRATGITVRRVDGTSFVVTQAEFRDGQTHEEIVTALNEVEAHHRTWGTWSPDRPLEISTDGQFDYVALDQTTHHWITSRAACDDLDLHTELSTLFDAVDVHYTDPSGAPHQLTRTASVPALNDANLPRTARLDAGSKTTEGAEALGDAFLALSGNFAPARGSVTRTQPIRHHLRGELPAHYMRADGSNLRLLDILPSASLFELDADPDRRSTFPIKRVDVDAGGEVPRVTIDVDQTNDVLSALQARLAVGAELAGV